MDAEQYLTERVQDQIDWHSKKSGNNQRSFKRLQIVVIVVSASLPLLAGLQGDVIELRWVIAGIGVLVAVLTALASLYRFQELWVDYRLTAESLSQEKYRFLTGTSPYDVGNALSILVERVESILSDQNAQWQQLAAADPPVVPGAPETPGDPQPQAAREPVVLQVPKAPPLPEPPVAAPDEPAEQPAGHGDRGSEARD